MTAICKVFDALRGPGIFEIFWRILTNASILSRDEVAAASVVLGANAIRYDDVRVAEGKLLNIIFRLNGNRAFATFHTINFPRVNGCSRKRLDIIVHELVHVLQFEKVGSVYIVQALKAQRKEGYSYGGWQQLAADWNGGKHFRDFNREQQGQIAQDYYNLVIAGNLPDEDPASLAYKPFIEELQNGDL
jgi:hypothetical protein